MLEIKYTANGFVANQEISSRLFEQTNSIIVEVTCEIPYYSDDRTLANSICRYMSSIMANGIDVKSDLAVNQLEFGIDENKGYYIKKMILQVYI